MRRRVLIGMASAVVLTTALEAQIPDTSMAGAAASVIRTARGHLDGERYGQALQLSVDYLRTSRVPRRNRLELLQIAAISAWPNRTAAVVGPDSARALLKELVRIEPEAALYEEYRWTGLDSLLDVAKRTTFGAAVRWRSRYDLVGDFAPATIEVVATRPVKTRLLLQRQGVGEVQTVDSTSKGPGGVLRLFAHDGSNAVLGEGSWFLQVIVVDSLTGDTLALPRVEAVAEGTAPTLMPANAALDTTLLLPEWQPPAKVTGIAYGVVMVASAVAVASAARSPEIRKQVAIDRRAISIGIVGGIGSVLAGWFDRGRPITANIARNRAVREEYAYRMRFITAFNKTNISNFRIKLVVDQEPRR